MGVGGIKLADYADPRAVSRGVGIAASAKSIAGRTVRRDEDVTVISARVASASGIADYFDASVMFGDYESRIVDYECTCPAIARFDGLCKHCVALVTAYFAQPRSFEEGAARVAVPVARRTSEALGRLLAEGKGSAAGLAALGSRSAEGAALGVAPGSVRLDVELIYDGRLWSLHLAVAGVRGTYQVRDIEAFAHHVQHGALHAYGKKLAFAHRLEAFDERSRAVVRVVSELFPDERIFGGSTFRTAGAGKREVRVREAEVVALLDALGEGAFTLVRRRGNAGAVEGAVAESWRVGADAPLEALLFDAVDGGYDVRLTEPVLVVRGLERAYVLADGVAVRVEGAEAAAFAFLREAGLADGGAAFVAESDGAAFCRRALPVLEAAVDVRLPEPWEALRPVAGKLAFYFDKTGWM